MKSSQQNNTKQVKLFFKSSILPSKPTVSLFPLPEDTQPRRINHMAKFKPFHEFQKPLIGFTPESFLDYVETVLPKDHLCRLVKLVLVKTGRGSIFIRYRSYRSHVFFFRSANVSSEVTLECAFLWVRNRRTQ